MPEIARMEMECNKIEFIALCLGKLAKALGSGDPKTPRYPPHGSFKFSSVCLGPRCGARGYKNIHEILWRRQSGGR